MKFIVCAVKSLDYIHGVVEGTWTLRLDRSGLHCGSVTYQLSDVGEAVVPVMWGFWHHFHRIVMGMKSMGMSYSGPWALSLP